ncbi:predicted protein [Enterococcus casseliflavus EC30]|nr:predicted protein [Enterococcus casseliflavus EC30]EEV36523.1 predicted protein [Enterococcus casseliflavus EC10]
MFFEKIGTTQSINLTFSRFFSIFSVERCSLFLFSVVVLLRREKNAFGCLRTLFTAVNE